VRTSAHPQSGLGGVGDRRRSAIYEHDHEDDVGDGAGVGGRRDVNRHAVVTSAPRFGGRGVAGVDTEPVRSRNLEWSSRTSTTVTSTPLRARRPPYSDLITPLPSTGTRGLVVMSTATVRRYL
jgi:hypothetical protein